MIALSLIVFWAVLILLAYYKSEMDSWRTNAMLWKKAAKYWEESYEIVSDGFDALWNSEKGE